MAILTRRVMNQLETFKMGQLMSANIRSVPVPDGAEPVCEYINGYDDARVAAEISPNLKAMHASTLRKNLFGTLNAKVPAPEANDDKRIAELGQGLRTLGHEYHQVLLAVAKMERTLANFVNEHTQLVGNHNKLCAAVTLARVGVDCRNLVVNGKSQHEVV